LGGRKISIRGARREGTGNSQNRVEEAAERPSLDERRDTICRPRGATRAREAQERKGILQKGEEISCEGSEKSELSKCLLRPAFEILERGVGEEGTVGEGQRLASWGEEGELFPDNVVCDEEKGREGGVLLFLPIENKDLWKV